LTKINRNNIQLGDSFVVSIEDSGHKIKIQEALAKEQEIILHGEQRAQEIIEQANLQAQQIIEDAEQEALSRVGLITQQAHDEGFEAGRQEGLENITQELQDKIIAVNDFAQSNFDIKNNIIKSAHSDIIRLIVEIAQKVCSTALELDDNILKELTFQAIKSLKDKEDIKIIVHPEMAQKIYAISDEFKAQIPQLCSIKIIEDASVSPDGTIVESPMSRVDSRVRSQINEIADKLMAKLDSTPNAETRPKKLDVIPVAKEEETGNREQEIEAACHCEEGETPDAAIQEEKFLPEENLATEETIEPMEEEIGTETVDEPVEEKIPEEVDLTAAQETE
jgi:flagellar assembly protein FliH